MSKEITERLELLERLAAALRWGDGLVHAREILKDEWSEEVERVAQALYCHEPFDLGLLIENYVAVFATECPATLRSSTGEATETSDFRFLNETLRGWLKSVAPCRVAALVCYIVLNEETAWASRENQAIQDYYAEECWYPGSIDWQNSQVCQDFIARAMKGMQNVDLHYIEAAEYDLDNEQVRVVDALRGWSPQVFDDEMVAAGKEIATVARTLLPAVNCARTREGARTYVKEVMDEVQRIADSHDVDVDIRDIYSLSTGYLVAWLDEKYWGDQRGEDAV